MNAEDFGGNDHHRKRAVTLGARDIGGQIKAVRCGIGDGLGDQTLAVGDDRAGVLGQRRRGIAREHQAGQAPRRQRPAAEAEILIGRAFGAGQSHRAVS